jgi:hypothetical protein
LESVRGFYAIGSTRIKLLDTLLLIVVAGSIGGPLAHMTIKRLFRGARRQSEGQARAAALAAPSSAPDKSTSDHSAR